LTLWGKQVAFPELICFLKVSHLKYRRLVLSVRYHRSAAWYCRNQFLGIRVCGIVKYLICITLFNDMSFFHYDDAISNLGYYSKIMGYEHNSHLFFFLDIIYELENLGL